MLRVRPLAGWLAAAALSLAPSVARAEPVQAASPSAPGVLETRGVARSGLEAGPVHPGLGLSSVRPVLGPEGLPVAVAGRRVAPPALARPARAPLRGPEVQEQGARRAVSPALLSLGVPGLGQLRLQRRRGWAYLALETLGWAFWVERRRAGADFRDRYRDLAWTEARIQSGPRVDAGFSYYETLTQWTRSGAFDADPTASGVQPETDPTTFNGAIWARAAGIFLPGGPASPPTDPGYASAIAYYGERAYPTAFLWDWTGSEPGQEELRRLIGESDDRFRQATNVLGAILANHVVSAIDAYVAARGVPARVELRARPAPGARTLRWVGAVRLGLGR